jgi:BirA family biotin operon repressor/biotin-[acetyl-CoA-carboxylase] ligase
MSMRYRLVELLADGQFRSGQWLGRELGITRAAVWKHVRSLGDTGLDVHAVRGKGYRLATAFQPLREAQIREPISASVLSRIGSFEVVHEIDSTSDYLKRSPVADHRPPGRVCIAEWQRAGRGRRGRRWVSPYGASLYLSLAWQLDESGVQTGSLSLVAAIAVLRALQQSGVTELGLKWPNDILLRDRKLAGILLEMSGEGGGRCQLVVGIGVNFNLPQPAAGLIDQPWADLSQYGAGIDRNLLTGRILENLVCAIDDFREHGLDTFMDEWNRHDAIAGRAVQLRGQQRLIASGVARGIDTQGALLIEHDGVTANYHAGEVSLRLA